MHRLTQNDAAGADASANNTTAESEEDEKLLKRLSEMLLDPGIFHTDKSDEPISNLCVEFFNIYFRTMSFFIIPILLLPLIILDYDSKPFKFFYVILIMSLFWTIKPIPPQVTALIPITMFPIFGIMKSEVVCGLYLSSENITSIAGMILGIAIEYSGIHKRLALQTVSMIGWNIRRLHSSIMLITAFLSFWVPNVAATSIMCPVVTAILDECKRHGLISSEELFEESKISKPKAVRRSKTKICFYIGLSYASSIGGMSTLTGTSQNLTMKNIYDRIFSKTQQPDPVGFAQWFLFMLIPVVVLLFATIVWLQFIYLGLFRYSMERNAEEEELIHAVVAMKLKVMGKVTPHEIITCLLFILGIFLCCFRTAGFQGWAELLYPDNPNFILESAPLIGIVILMFIIPQTCECFQYCRTGVPRDSYPRDPTDPVLTWKYTHHKFPWQLIFFMGAGYAIAGGATESGAAKWLESKLTILDVVPNFAILMMVFFFTIMLSNFMTGGAISNVVLPLLLQMAVVKKIHPFYLMIPCGIASSLTFLTQIGTPTNAYVATYGNIPSYDLLFSGLFPTLFSIVLFPFIFIFWGKFIFPVIFQDFNT